MIYDEILKIDLERVNSLLKGVEECLKIAMKTK